MAAAAEVDAATATIAAAIAVIIQRVWRATIRVAAAANVEDAAAAIAAATAASLMDGQTIPALWCN